MRVKEGLAQFHPLVAQWFEQRVGHPTDVQERAWPKIAAGDHLLISAPTGTGKTLAAFLWAINRLVAGIEPAGRTSVLYISPLRALNYDIQRNLLGPLEEIKEGFEKEGKEFPEVRVLTRSGDTPPSERRRMLRHPPEILISTPESLNLLLSSPRGRSILTGLSTVILDEIHSVAGNKRGVLLMTGVERLVPLSGEFQRIALSATIRPLKMVAEFVGGFQVRGTLNAPQYISRPVTVVCSEEEKQYDLHLRFRGEALNEGEKGSRVWGPIVEELKDIIRRNRSTLIFVNSRRLCETLTLRINEGEEEPIAYAHHGSLGREIRSEVERKLKAGELRAIVATHSLELGIDIGALDEVLLVQAPFSVSSAIQRVGRAGHRVGEVSRGTMFPTHPKDLLEAAVMTPAILAHDIEDVKPVLSPLDVLAQVVISMVGVETWGVNSLFAALRASYPYRRLSRKQFDLVMSMLAGRYARTRIRELKPRLSIDHLEGTVAARKGALQALYSSGGVIPDRGYFILRHQETGARIGELDEEFVWEASVGDTFSLGTQNWCIQQITHNDVLVLPAPSKGLAIPFWKAEENGRDFHFSERMAEFLEEADGSLETSAFRDSLQETHCLEPPAADRLIDFLRIQREETGCSLPHRHHLVVESVASGPGGVPGNMTVIHTLWGGRVNRPLAMALDAAWEEKFHHRLEFYTGNDSIAILLPHGLPAEELLSLAGSSRVESLLRRRLEGSGFFGARFRECARRALLLTKARWGERMPLWLSRLQSQKLLEAVLQLEDFPILLETWRTCLREEFDLESLKRLLAELEAGAIAWTEVRTGRPSPFARSDWWRQVSRYMYRGDEPQPDKTSRLRGDLLQEVVSQPGLRPPVSPDLVRRFELKRQRLSPGYSPQTPRELLDWAVDRVMLPRAEWEELLKAMKRDHGLEAENLMGDLQGKMVRIHPPGAGGPLVLARENLGPVLNTFYRGEGTFRVESLEGVLLEPELMEAAFVEEEGEDFSLFLGQWLQFYGPRMVGTIQKILGVKTDPLRLALEDLADSQKVVRGSLVAGGERERFCDRENFETLLRLGRAESRPVMEPREVEWLSLFLATYQGITEPRKNLEGLRDRLEQLLCYPAEAGMWEAEIFPARVRPYDPSWLDTLVQEGDLQWIGSEGHRVAFCFEADLDLLQEDIPRTFSEEPRTEVLLEEFFPDPGGRYDFSALLRHARLTPANLAEKLWNGVWQGRVTNDGFLPLRQAVMNKFKTADPLVSQESAARRWGGRRGAQRKQGRFFPGNWHLVARAELPEDLIEAGERRKDRARLLLDRYGILFRELLQRELPALSWSGVFRALRIMELGGEVIAGYFFKGIPGPQFVSPRALRMLQGELPKDAVYWMNAADPASLCGIQLDSRRGRLPPRLSTTHLVYRGMKLTLVSRRTGRDLEFLVPPDDPRLPEYLAFFRHLLGRRFHPVRRIAIERINGEEAPHSPYVPALRNCFEVLLDYRQVNLLGGGTYE